jgi:hypothetical protein
VEKKTGDLSGGVEPPGEGERVWLPVEKTVVVVGLVADRRDSVPQILPVGAVRLTVEEVIPSVPIVLIERPGLAGALSLLHVEPDPWIRRQKSARRRDVSSLAGRAELLNRLDPLRRRAGERQTGQHHRDCADPATASCHNPSFS